MSKASLNRHVKPIVLLAFILICPQWASAAQVTNLSDKPQTIELLTPEGYTPIVIEPGRNWNMVSKVTLRYAGREYRLDVKEEYSLWPDGTLGPQRANSRGGRLF